MIPYAAVRGDSPGSPESAARGAVGRRSAPLLGKLIYGAQLVAHWRNGVRPANRTWLHLRRLLLPGLLGLWRSAFGAAEKKGSSPQGLCTRHVFRGDARGFTGQ